MSCDQPMHIVKVNPYFAFWVHTPEEQPRCAELNPCSKNTPLIRDSGPYFHKLIEKQYLEHKKALECSARG